MATKLMYFRGKCKWLRADQLNPWGKWAMTLYPDQETLEIVRDLQAQGLKNVIKKDDDGYYFSVSRPQSINVNNKPVGLAAPLVLDGRHKLEDGGYAPLRAPVGNGSDVTVEVEVYQHRVPGGTGKGTAMRWKSVRVDNLVPFADVQNYPEEDRESVKKFGDQPTQEGWN